MSDLDYTPTANEMRNVFLDEFGDADGFDVWLASERAAAWDRGARAGAESERTSFGRKVSWAPLVNPYRTSGVA